MTDHRGAPLLRLLVVVGVVGALALPLASAQPSDGVVLYGVTRLADDRSIPIPDPAWLCVRDAMDGDDVTLVHRHGDDEDLVLFLHVDEAAACQTLTGGGSASLPGGGDVRVLVLPGEPVERHGPGVVRLGGAGSAIRIDDVGPSALIGVLSETIGTRTQILDARTLEVLTEVVDVEEVSLHGTEDDLAGRDVLVVVRDSVVESSILTRWEDPDWYAANPSVGIVAAVIAAALFLVLWKGRPAR